MNWDRYIGIPFAEHDAPSRSGTNCWGLVRLVYLEQLHILLPSYDNDHDGLKDIETIDHLIRYEIVKRWPRIHNPNPLDTISIGEGNTSAHIGMYVDKQSFLHTIKNSSSQISEFGHFLWRSRPMTFHRYTPCYR